MTNSLPTYVNPWLLFRQNEVISGTADLSAMPNLVSSQIRQSGEVVGTFSVEKRDDGETVIRGNAYAELELVCQRCLKPFAKEYRADFELVLVKNERQLEYVDAQDDAIVVEEQLDVLPLLEQELILALPMIAKHDDCQAHYENVDSGEIKTQQPFSNLKDLLN